MTRRLMVTIGVAWLALAGTRPAAAVDAAAARERVGFRPGYTAAFGGLHDAYGDGWDLTLYLTEKVSTHFLFDFRLGAIYLGAPRDTTLDDQVTKIPGQQSELRIFYLGIAPLVSFPLGGPRTGYATAGVGFYSINVPLTSTVSGLDLSDQHPGLNASLGFCWRFATSWSIEANGTLHYIHTRRDASDLYWTFTGGAADPLMLGVSIGATLDLR